MLVRVAAAKRGWIRRGRVAAAALHEHEAYRGAALRIFGRPIEIAVKKLARPHTSKRDQIVIARTIRDATKTGQPDRTRRLFLLFAVGFETVHVGTISAHPVPYNQEAPGFRAQASEESG
jgi:hypothetical protein